MSYCASFISFFPHSCWITFLLVLCCTEQAYNWYFRGESLSASSLALSPNLKNKLHFMLAKKKYLLMCCDFYICQNVVQIVFTRTKDLKHNARQTTWHDTDNTSVSSRRMIWWMITSQLNLPAEIPSLRPPPELFLSLFRGSQQQPRIPFHSGWCFCRPCRWEAVWSLVSCCSASAPSLPLGPRWNTQLCPGISPPPLASTVTHRKLQLQGPSGEVIQDYRLQGYNCRSSRWCESFGWEGCIGEIWQCDSFNQFS